MLRTGRENPSVIRPAEWTDTVTPHTTPRHYARALAASRTRLLVDALVLLMIPLLMSAPGLLSRWRYRSSLLDCCSTWLENVVLLSTGHRLLNAALSSNSPRRRRYAAAALSVLTLVAFVFAFAHLCFQMRTGGRVPSQMLVISGIHDAGVTLAVEMHTQLFELLYTGCKVAFFYVQGVLLYAASVRMSARTPVLLSRFSASNRLHAPAIAALLVGYGMGGLAPVTHITICIIRLPLKAGPAILSLSALSQLRDRTVDPARDII